MAKKSFKSGLDNLIEDNYENIKDHVTKSENKNSEQSTISDEKAQWLLNKIEKLMLELKKWRTGELNVEKFHKSLSDIGLKYNPDTNLLEKI